MRPLVKRSEWGSKYFNTLKANQHLQYLLGVFFFIIDQNKILPPTELRQQRVVTDTIVELINRASQWIRDSGLDPVVIEEARGSYALSEPE